MGWLIYRLTGSALTLGIVAFASQFPGFLIAPIAGVLLDRWNRYRILLVTQVLFLLQAAVLAALVVTNVVEIWHIIALSCALGLIAGFDAPARQSFLVQLVGSTDLPNAIALNSSLFNAARLVGPAVAGILIGATGEGPVFVVNALSYLAVVGAILALRNKRSTRHPRKGHLLRNLGAGFQYAFTLAPIRAVLIMLALMSFAGVSFIPLLPVFATDVLQGGPHTLGFLMAASGLGALGGGYFLARRNSVHGLPKLILVAALLFSFGLTAFALSRDPWLSTGLLMVCGFGLMVLAASMNTLLQTVVEDAMRGRVMSLYAMAFMGMAPVGSLLGGAIADLIGAPATVLLGALTCAAGAAWFSRQLPEVQTAIRPIYMRLGILPEISTSLHVSTEYRPR